MLIDQTKQFKNILIQNVCHASLYVWPGSCPIEWSRSLNYRRIFASKDQKFVRIIEKFELTNFELSDEFC